MGAISKLKWGVSFLLICFTTSLMAQNENNEAMLTKLYEVYKEKGVDEVLKVYQKENTNTAYEGMAEPLNVLAYRIMQEEEDLQAAAVLLKAQIDEYPEEANPYDSYSDVLLEMGNQDEAVKNIEKSLAIAEKNEHIENNLVLEAGKAKLAILNNKDKQLNFLVGNWDNETQMYSNGEKTNSSNSSNKISFDETGSMLVVDHDTAGDKPCCKRVMVYNPVDDEFDVSYMRRTQPNGIKNSKMKVNEISSNHFEVIESYMNAKNEQVELKHDIVKNAGNVDWMVYTEGDNGWEKVRSMNLKKKD